MADDGPDLRALQPFVGHWSVAAEFPSGDVSGVRGWTTFEWVLGRRFLVQRSGADHPDAPEVHALIAPDDRRPDGFVQHYFDSRGVVRLYAMTFDGSTWTLTRLEPDFSPLDFRQRFTGTFADGADTIRGRWETSDDGVEWRLDFGLTYHRTA
ncbi:hypothetical protein [Geodermatophilus sp. URMC 64]